MILDSNNLFKFAFQLVAQEWITAPGRKAIKEEVSFISLIAGLSDLFIVFLIFQWDNDREDSPLIVSASDEEDATTTEQNDQITSSGGITTLSGRKLAPATESLPIPPSGSNLKTRKPRKDKKWKTEEERLDRRRLLDKIKVKRKREKQRMTETEEEREKRVKYWKDYREKRKQEETPDARKKRLARKNMLEKIRVQKMPKEKRKQIVEKQAKWRRKNAAKLKNYWKTTTATDKSDSSQSESETPMEPRQRRKRPAVNYKMDTEDEDELV